MSSFNDIEHSRKAGTSHEPMIKKRPGIRPFEREDMPQIVQLLSKMFPRSDEATIDVKEHLLSELLLNNPWNDERLPSLVYETKEGKITGFLGVAPREMIIGDRPVTAAISYNLMVDPDSRSTLAGINLVRTFLQGPQDLSFADSANNTSRSLWERLGGITVPLYSIYWKCPIRPTGFMFHHLGKRRYFNMISRVAMPLSKLADRVVNQFWDDIDKGRLYEEYEVKDASAEELLNYIGQFSEEKLFRPVYTSHKLSWLLSLADKPKRFGKLRKEVVYDRNGKLAGWFIYYECPGGVSEILQIQAVSGKKADVLALLIQRVKDQGSVGLAGRLNPEWTTIVPTTAFCWYMPGRVWMIAHSKDEQILNALKSGDVFMSRIEGDMWLL